MVMISIRVDYSGTGLWDELDYLYLKPQDIGWRSQATTAYDESKNLSRPSAEEFGWLLGGRASGRRGDSCESETPDKADLRDGDWPNWSCVSPHRPFSRSLHSPDRPFAEQF
jgi:hypothetical protein